ncbi:MAG: hypothetical protein IPP18_00005, partial [Rhodocyclaceae bacterium]|nr:hypothetical protein [Rhodocyclaceae bacterium]
QGRVQLGIAHQQLAGRAIAGGELLKQPVTNLRAIAVIDPQAAMQVFARQRSGFESLSRFGDKKPIRVSFLNLRGTMMALAGEELPPPMACRRRYRSPGRQGALRRL